MSDALSGGAAREPYYYSDGGVTIYHGRCEDVLPGLPAFDVLCSDPPYGMGYRHGARKGGVRLGHDGESIAGDFGPFDPSHLLHLAPRVILWGGNHFADKLSPSRGWLVWDKRDGRPSNDQSDVELAWTNWLTTARAFSAFWSGGVRTGREQAEGRLHVNQKPVALMAWCLRIAEAKSVLDPYMGSGSTLVAAKDAGIPAVGIELEERHCETAAQRLSQGVLDLGAA